MSRRLSAQGKDLLQGIAAAQQQMEQTNITADSIFDASEINRGRKMSRVNVAADKVVAQKF